MRGQLYFSWRICFYVRLLCLLMAACLLSLFSYSQAVSDTFQRVPYLFDHFINGTVLLKSGAVEQAPLNYNTKTQGILFKKENQDYDLVGLETIDTVYIENEKFVPQQSKFYQVVASKPIELYATYTCKAQPVSASAEHDRSVRRESSEVSNDVSNVYVTRQYRGDYTFEFHKQYWLKRYRDFYKVNNEKQVLKLFPKNEQAIRAFITENKIDFTKEADLIKLLAFCSSES